jgi:D-alanyl-D-alanine dipeptidase
MIDDLFTKITFLSLLIPLFATYVQAENLTGSPALRPSRQAVVVTSSYWDNLSATLQRYERSGTDRPWTKVGEKIPVVIGRTGLGWGKGLHPFFPEGEPVKKEGDDKAPAGIFRLSAAFGYAPPAAMDRVRLPYIQATPDLLCVDDTASAHYNCIVDKVQTRSDWKSSDDMLRKDDQYRLGIVVDHNAASVVPGNGSCIFMHIWAGPGMGTAGCTAMAAGNMEALLHWLSPHAHPVLIQLPEGVYKRERKAWELP